MINSHNPEDLYWDFQDNQNIDNMSTSSLENKTNPSISRPSGQANSPNTQKSDFGLVVENFEKLYKPY